MKVLVACEFSGRVREAFAKLGHDAWSCDLLETEIPGNHIIGDVLEVISSQSWDLMIAHPPCTYLAYSGVCWLYGGKGKVRDEARWADMEKAALFFKTLLDAPIHRIAVENPVMHRYGMEIIGKRYGQIVQPWQFGEGETKKTCLWLKNLPPLMATLIASGRGQKVHMHSPTPDRWKNRSRTYQGIANAMAWQWSGLKVIEATA